MILAKSKGGVTLINHSRSVEYVAGLLFDTVTQKSLKVTDPSIRLMVTQTALLHDIGKACAFFQSFLKKQKNTFEELSSEELEEDYYDTDKKFYAHNEIGWAFLHSVYNGREYGNVTSKDTRDIVPTSVLWHHAPVMTRQSLYYRMDVDAIMKSLTVEDVRAIMDVYTELTGNTFTKETPSSLKNIFISGIPNQKAPMYWDFVSANGNIPHHRMFRVLMVRTMVIIADRIVSKLEEGTPNDMSSYDYIVSKVTPEYLAQTWTKKTFSMEFSADIFDIKRLSIQDDYLNATEKNNVVLKAPAGFGKTLMGLKWASISNNKTLWVCPRNEVVEAVYGSILEEFRKTKTTEVTVQRFVTGIAETSKVILNDLDEYSIVPVNMAGFEADITVTNIDAFVSPTAYVVNKNAILMTYTADVIFDEFHEFVTESSLLGLFKLLGDIRFNTKSRTIFMSATPSLIVETLFSEHTNDTQFLPSKTEHMPAAHSRLYEMEVKTVNESVDIKFSAEKDSTLIIGNAIRSAQNIWEVDDRKSLLTHSNFTPTDRQKVMSKVKHLYGNKNTVCHGKQNVSSAPILQASMDLSFAKVYEITMSPENTLQRLGRCNRWGNYEKTGIFHMYFTLTDKSNLTAIRNQYNMSLNQKWMAFVSEKLKDGNMVTLDLVYEWYNEFNGIEFDHIVAHITDVVKISLNNLARYIKPIRLIEGVKKNKRRTAGSKIRKTDGESYFVTARIDNLDNEWCEPISYADREYNSLFKDFSLGYEVRKRIMENFNTPEWDQVLTQLKYIENGKNSRGTTREDIVGAAAKLEETPYILLGDYAYHPEKGLYVKR